MDLVIIPLFFNLFKTLINEDGNLEFLGIFLYMIIKKSRFFAKRSPAHGTSLSYCCGRISI